MILIFSVNEGTDSIMNSKLFRLLLYLRVSAAVDYFHYNARIKEKWLMRACFFSLLHNTLSTSSCKLNHTPLVAADVGKGGLLEIKTHERIRATYYTVKNYFDFYSVSCLFFSR